jgi:hypothetical protein
MKQGHRELVLGAGKLGIGARDWGLKIGDGELGLGDTGGFIVVAPRRSDVHRSR